HRFKSYPRNQFTVDHQRLKPLAPSGLFAFPASLPKFTRFLVAPCPDLSTKGRQPNKGQIFGS
ncbi:MAG: hypothetical protein ACO34E_12860, partial [Limisphaerales bacterium]